MPSAARQRLPSELWKSPVPSSKGPVPSYIGEIQAHPGYSDSLHNEAHLNKSGNSALEKLSRRQLTPTQKKNKKNLPRRGSSDDILRDQAEVEVRENNQCVSSSVCSDSECGVSYNSTDCSGFFAVDSVKAPAVNALPLPPPEWLKSFCKYDSNAPAMKKTSFQAFLGTLVKADRHV